MLQIFVVLPPNTPDRIVDAITVQFLDTSIDRMPKYTHLEAITKRDDELILTFTN